MGETRYLAGDIGIRTGDDFHRVLARGRRLPRKARATLRTDEDDQSSLEFTIVQRLGGAFSAAFRRTRIDGLPPRPRGRVKIVLLLEVSSDGEMVARVRRPDRRQATEIARGRAETATREGLERATRDTAAVGPVERGLVPPGRLESIEEPVAYACDRCGRESRFTAVSLVATASEGFSCDGCGSVLLVPALDNMAASFFRGVPGGRIGLADAPASVDAERAAAHGEALARISDALRPCSCGGRFGALGPVPCPGCGASIVDPAGDPVFRARQTHLLVPEEARVIRREAGRLWTAEHLEPYERDVRLGTLERVRDHLVLPLEFRNRDGWLFIPVQYALALRSGDGTVRRSFRPVKPAEGDTPEAWQARQDEADEAFAREIEDELGFRPLLGRVEPDAGVSGRAVFPGPEEISGPGLLVVGRTLELPLA